MLSNGFKICAIKFFGKFIPSASVWKLEQIQLIKVYIQIKKIKGIKK
jgi:hypothetical protein